MEELDLRDKKVLVTGAGGFIGSHLTERLIGLASKVRAFVRYNSRNDWGLLESLPKKYQKSLEIMLGDLKDPEAVRKAVKGCDVVFHLGALIAIPYSYINPYDFVQSNILGTANMLNACKEYSVEKIVHTSTSEVYGSARYVPINEEHPLQGQSPYSASKIGADKLAESYYLAYQLPVSVIRPFNTYGPRQSARAIIPTIITQALSNNIIKLGSLWPRRDLTFVDDTVEGFIKIAVSSDSLGKVINIGSGYDISIGELAEKIVSIISKKIDVVEDSARVRPANSEVKRLLCDNNQAKEILDWKPNIELDKGLEKTIEWITQNLDKYKQEIYNV